MADRIFPLRLDDERRERWDAAAKSLGVSLAKFVRDVVDAEEARIAGGGTVRGGSVESVVPADNAQAGTAHRRKKSGSAREAPAASSSRTATRGKRSEICEHRRRPDEYCGRCDV